MKDFKYHLSVHDCRAIKSAEIDLSEITVLTGVNASGKSTLARMFRDLVELSAEYERLLAVQMWNGRMDMWRYAVVSALRVQTEGAMFLQRKSIAKGLARGVLTFSAAIDLLDRTLQEVLAQVSASRDPAFHIQRMRRLLRMDENMTDLLVAYREEAAKILEKFEKRRNQRSYVAYRELMRGNPLGDGKVSLTEGDRVVFSNDGARDSLDEVLFVKRAIYIESPFKSIPLSVSPSELNMGDAFTRIKEDVAPNTPLRLAELSDVISGDVDFKRDYDDDESEDVRALMGHDGRWMFHRRDGSDFALEECATGIKAFSILRILHARGWLDAETLLIIDEPEAHLHPQWIVEYARILLVLSKRLKVRIVVTSHSPDMVNALHTIGLSLGMGPDMGFYLAEPDEHDQYRFNYRGLGNKVGDIFKAYNMSFERIDDYAMRGVL